MRTTRMLLALTLMLALGLTTARPVAGQEPSTGGPPPRLINYPAGWNIIAVTQLSQPFGTGPLYALQAGDPDYEVIPLTARLRPRVGYWIYLSQDTRASVIPVTSCEVLIPVPAGGNSKCGLAHPDIAVPPGQWVMIGNPISQAITVMGADAVYTYDPTAGSYAETSTLQVGQGAFVYSSAGGMVTISPSPS